MAPWTTFLLGPLLVGFWPSFDSDPLQQRFPLEARGSIMFQADAARFRGPDGPTVEVFLSVPRDSLMAANDSAHLSVQIEPLDRRKHSLGRFRTVVHLPPAAPREEGGFPVSRGWMRLSPPWIKGAVGLRVRVEDLDRPKRGLLDRVRNKLQEGEAAARIVPDGEPEALGRLSDLLFAWGPSPIADTSDGDGAAGGFRRVRLGLEPNPYRYYGLFQPVLTAYWERYPAEGETPGAVVETRRIVQMRDTVEVAAERETLAVGADPTWMLRRWDLAGLPGGAYSLEILLHRLDGTGGLLARTAGAFQVVWEKKNWLRGEAELLDIARVLLLSTDFERFERLDRGSQETFLLEFWSRHAPGESGAVNSLERVFEQRRSHAESFFRGQRRGMLSDRGRVFIRLGPADDIRAELNPNDDQMLWQVLPQEIAAGGETSDAASAQPAKRRTRLDNRAYEVWEYTTHGDPLLPEYISPGLRFGLKFIFVDELGTGDYTLVYTSAPSVLQ